MRPQTITSCATPPASPQPAEPELVGRLDGRGLSGWRGVAGAATLQAAPSVALEAAAQLWRLSRYALENDQVRAVVESCDSWQVPIVLNATSAGRELLAGIDAYDRRYRRRAGNDALIAPSWLEDPTPVVEGLREFMRRSDFDAPASLSLAA